MLNKINISPDRQKLIVYIVLAAVTLAVYWQVNQYDFIIEDNVYVTENSHVQSGITLDGIRWAFSTTYAEFWHPLTWLSLMFDYQLYGLNAGGYHVTNLVLHILSTLLLFWLFNRMTGAIWKSAFVAALFALHPLHVESVAWISERKDVLSAFFWMLTLCLYVYYTEKPVIRRYLPVLFFFVCGLMSKSMVVTLPVIMILLDYWPLGRFQSRKGNVILWQLKEKILFFILSAIFSIITLYAHQCNPSGTHFTLASRFVYATISFVTYLEKTFWPHDMAVFYPLSEQILAREVLLAFLLILIITAAVIAAVKRLPYLFVGWLWYAITLLPVIGILKSDYVPFMADHFTYLPSIGISIMLVWGIPLLFPCKDLCKKILLPAAMAILFVLAVLTWRQCGYWKNSIELWNHALKVTEDTALAHNNLGIALFAEGKIEEAINHYNSAISISPTKVLPYYNRGSAYAKLGQYQRAIADYNEVISLEPYNIMAYNNRGIAYAGLRQYQQSIEEFNTAINIKANYADAYHNRGLSYFNQGKKELGCQDAQKACELGNCKALELAKNKGLCR